MKFLVYSNSPGSLTGYGVQCAHLVERLKRDGHDVAVACNYGQQNGAGVHRTPYGDVRLYPMSESAGNSIETIIPHALDWFNRDPRGGWIISLIDQWVLLPIARELKEFNVLAWTPVDHWPTPPEVAKFFALSDAVPVGMSKYAHSELAAIGLDPEYVPLAVDTSAYRPSPELDLGGDSPVDARAVFGIPDDVFAVLMVAMNKDPRDRKGFNEAFRAFGKFHESHPDSVLVVHSDHTGAMGSGINLERLARHAGVPQESLVLTSAYARLLGVPASMMAGLFSAADVLLCPSRGEGFGVPMIEAQACGTPVIASDFSAQSELIGVGWKVGGQPDYDASQDASYQIADIGDIVAALEECYAQRPAPSDDARSFALGYDVDVVWRDNWQPLIESLSPPERSGLPKMKRVDVLVPYVRESNRDRLVESFNATAPDGKAKMLEGVKGKSYAENVNALLAESDADWVLVVGDDVEFTPGWFSAARDLSDRYDVIGTNDSEAGRVRNPAVAKGEHADHFMLRRSYIDDEGASLDGPGVLAPECYRHWWVDREIIGLARARGVYGHAHDCRIIHHHPGYDGDEDARRGDLLYMMAVNSAEDDQQTFAERSPLIVEQMTWRGKL